MNIAGLQKVSTVDYPGKISCVIFLHGCNFRCGFCYNTDLVTKKYQNNFTEKQILDFLESRKDKLDAVVISGGEPLISLDKNFVKKIRELDYKIKLDTNGSFPEKLKELIDEELIDYIAMDIKGDKQKYSKIAGTNVDISKIEESIKIINDFKNSEFRTTILEKWHDKKSLEKMSRWLNEICNKKPKKIYLQGFRNDLGEMIDKKYSKELKTTEKYLEEMKNSIKDYFEKVEIRI
jgi:pyruvate formate lyase activating enzyme